MEAINSNFSVLLMLIITVILISVNCLEIFNLLSQWQKGVSGNMLFFEKCLKYPYILKSFFILFSIFATVSVFLLTFGLLLNPDFFLRKFSKTYIQFNYIIFGPGLCICALIGFYHFDLMVHTCEIRYNIYLVYNVSNAFSIIICFIVSVLIWIGKTIYDTLVIYSNSITRHPSGSYILRSVFWWAIRKIRTGERQNNNSENNIQENINNRNIDYYENINNFQRPAENNEANLNRDEFLNLQNQNNYNNQRIIIDSNSNNNQDNRLNSDFLIRNQNDNGESNNLIQQEEVKDFNNEEIIKKNLEFLNRLNHRNPDDTLINVSNRNNINNTSLNISNN